MYEGQQGCKYPSGGHLSKPSWAHTQLNVWTLLLQVCFSQHQLISSLSKAAASRVAVIVDVALGLPDLLLQVKDCSCLH